MLGETTLLFANQVKESGRVFSFEFIPGNLNILHKCLAINPNLGKIVKVIENPLWSESNINMYYKDSGPGSIVSFNPIDYYSGKVKTLSMQMILLNMKN